MLKELNIVRGLLTIPISLILGCGSFQNDIHRQVYECGERIGNESSSLILKPVFPESSSSLPEGAPTQAFWKDIEGRRHEARSTSKSCFLFPKTAKALYFFQPSSESGTVIADPVNLTPGTVLRVKMQALPKTPLRLNCPETGLFASETLSLPLSAAFDIRALNIMVDFESATDRKDRSLILHSFESSDGKDYLDLEDIPEGVYSLRLRQANIAQYLSGTSTSSPGPGCPLTVIKTSPHLILGSELLEIQTFAQHTILDWKPASTSEELYSCMEPASVGFQVDPKQCVASTHCALEGNFRSVNAIQLTDTGLWNVFAFSRNRLGRKSSTRCATFGVSKAPPQLTLQWDLDRLNIKNSALDLPRHVLKASIDVSHELLQSSALENNLECKVDFLIQGRESMASDRVRCLNGRCAGKSLKDFTPCSQKISFSIARLWDQNAVAQSILRLSVRAHDGAGHHKTASIALVLDATRWKKVLLDPAVSQVESLHSMPDDTILILGKNRVSLLKDDISSDILEVSGANPALATTPSGRHLIYWSDPNLQNTTKFVSILGNNITEPTVLSGCAKIIGFGEEHAWCQNSNEIIAIYSKDSKISKTIQPPGECAEPDTLYKVGGNDELLVACKDRIIRIFTDDRPTTTLNSPIPMSMKPISLSLSRSKEFWIYYRSLQSNSEGRLVRIHETGLESLDLPPATKRTLISDLGFLLDDEDRPTFAGFVWDSTSRAWSQALPDLDENIASMLIPRKVCNGPTAFHDERGLYVKFNGDFLYWPSDVAKISFDPTASIICKVKDGFLALVTDEGNSQKSLYTLGRIRFTSFNEKATGAPFSWITGIWENSEGHLEIAASADAALYRYQEGTWTKVADLEVGTEFPNRVYHQSHDQFYIQTNKGIWTKASYEERARLIVEFAKLPAYPIFFVEDNEGIVWFALDSGRSLLKIEGSNWELISLPGDNDSDIIALTASKTGVVVHTRQETFASKTVGSQVMFDRINDTGPRPETNWRSWSLANGQMAMQTKDKVIALLDGDRKLIRQVSLANLSPRDLRQNYVVEQDAQGRLYLFMNNAIYREEAGTFRAQLKSSAISAILGSPNSSFSQFHLDQSNSIWIVGQPFQLIRLDPQ